MSKCFERTSLCLGRSSALMGMQSCTWSDRPCLHFSSFIHQIFISGILLGTGAKVSLEEDILKASYGLYLISEVTEKKLTGKRGRKGCWGGIREWPGVAGMCRAHIGRQSSRVSVGYGRPACFVGRGLMSLSCPFMWWLWAIWPAHVFSAFLSSFLSLCYQ